MTEVHYLIPRLGVGGAERTLVHLVNNLSDEYTATIWTLLPPGQLAEEVNESVPVRSVHASGKHDMKSAVRLFKQVRAAEPDIVQSFLYFDNLLARLIGTRKPDISVVCGVRCVPEDPSRVRVAIDSATVGLADHIVSNSRAGAKMIVQRGASKSDVSVIHNGRNIETYRDATSPPEFKTAFDISTDSLVIGTVGRLIERKGQYELLDAFGAVKNEHPESELVIVGDGPEEEGLKSRRSELGLEDSIHFAGLRDDVPQLLNGMDLFAFPSYYEGLPGALIEAMAAGLPIVATDVAGNNEVVSDGETGILVPAKDPETLSSGIDTLLSNPDQAQLLSSNAAEVAHRQFSIETMVSEFESLYEELE